MDEPANPVPHSWTSLQLTGRSKYLTSLDMQAAFMTMELDEDSIPYTALSIPFGPFEYATGCRGISCMPPEIQFQRRVEKAFGPQIEQNWLRIYIVDQLSIIERYKLTDSPLEAICDPCNPCEKRSSYHL
jgi:hypothetical protein